MDLVKELSAVLYRAYETEAMAAFSEFFTGELHALQYLSKHRGADVFPSEMSEALHVSRARVAAILSSLRKKGYVAMALCEADRRRMQVAITAEGLEYLSVKQEKVRLYLHQWTQRMGEENTRNMIRLLTLSLEDKEPHA